MKFRFSRIERWVWYLFLATAAWQTRLIVWQADSHFIEWRSASVYLSDVLMAALFVFWAVSVVRGESVRVRTTDWLLGALFAAAVLSLANAEHLSVGLIGLLRLAQCVALYLYVRSHALSRFSADMSAVAFVVGALGQALLGIAQYALQRDVGIRWVGETLLRTDMRGVAVFYDLAHEKVLRAYGALPHPNILAAVLMVALWVVVWLWVKHINDSSRSAVLWHATAAVLLVGMYLTFARTVIAVWAVAWGVCAFVLWCDRISGSWQNITLIRKRLVPLCITLGIVSVGFLVVQWPQVVARMTIAVSDEAVQQRLRYNADALASGDRWTFDVNWTGVGIGNFTTWLARYDRALPSFITQPAHNIYLMAYSEIGAVGLSVWVLWLASVVAAARTHYRGEPAVRSAMIALTVSLLLIGSLDHFFWTLQQGRILWWTALALAAGKS